jgi:hypothetical protein
METFQRSRSFRLIQQSMLLPPELLRFLPSLGRIPSPQRPRPLLRLRELHDCGFSTVCVKTLFLLSFAPFESSRDSDACASTESSRTHSAISLEILNTQTPKGFFPSPFSLRWRMFGCPPGYPLPQAIPC